MSEEEKRCWDELPTECWEIILDFLNLKDYLLEPISLVCKRFLSISNHLRSRLNITGPTTHFHHSISPLLGRFHHLKRLDLDELPLGHFRGNLHQILLEIASSELKLEALNLSNWWTIPLDSFEKLGEKMNKTMKVLICSRVLLGDVELNAIRVSFPLLEELDISYPKGDYSYLHRDPNSGLISGIITDSGIELVTSLLNLEKINISGNHFITDASLKAIALNCEFLKEIIIVDCDVITKDGINNFISKKPNLVSLTMNELGIYDDDDHNDVELNLAIEKALACAKDLQALRLFDMTISDELIFSIQEADLPLQKLAFPRCSGFSVSSISFLLSKYQTLNYLDLEGASFLTHLQMERLSSKLTNLTFICLNSCSQLTTATFFTLVKICSSLEEIHMEGTGLGKKSLHTQLKKNTRIRVLKVARNIFLDDECLKKLVSVCPNLVSLDVSHCSKITGQGVQEVGNICRKITELEVNECPMVKNIGTVEFAKLEVLRANGSGFNDKGLSMLGESCTELLSLSLECCLEVSDEGLKQLIRNCKKLREVNLKDCEGVSFTVLAWIVLFRQTLRKITPPPGRFVDGERDMFLRCGCVISD